ncbi:MAG: SPOR domain-containing protein, partial [Aestuariivirgaceae bacterium]
TRLRVSSYGAARPPSKLGLRAGSTIRVKDAIGALVTKSANDVATTVAENLAGSESAFAARMTSKARALGMTRTTFRNASGLPNSAQITTARDMATLALRIQKDFPKHYKYFATRSYAYGKRRYRNHNRLLGRVSGVDGIKTGYTRASGFNLVTSARRGKSRVIAVVMGAKSGGSRNRYMTSLVNRMFKTKRLVSGSHLARVAGTPPGYKPQTRTKIAARIPVAPPLPRSKPVGDDALGVDDSIGMVVASTQQPSTFKQITPSNAPTIGDVVLNTASLQAGHPDRFVKRAAVKSDQLQTSIKVPPPANNSIADKIAETAVTPDPKVPQKSDVDSHLKSWNIQIGAFPTAKGARSRLDKAVQKAAANLRGKKPFTMKFSKGKSTYYRARFSGFTRRTAQRACRTLTKKGLGCFALAPKG